MRKLLSICLLAVIGLAFVQPLLALGDDMESRLPACCRRAGAHHCASDMAAAVPAQGPSVSAIPRCCESFPKAIGPSQHHDLTLDTAALAFAEVVSHPAVHRQTEARARVALDRSRRKRGPPATLLA